MDNWEQIFSLIGKVSIPVFTFVIGAWWTTWRSRVSEIVNQINELQAQINEIQTVTTEYWCSDYNDKNNIIKQAKIRGMIFNIGIYEYKADLLFQRNSELFRELLDELNVAATGGNFETKYRISDFPRSIEIQQTCSRFKELCRSARYGHTGLWPTIKFQFYLLNRFVDGIIDKYINENIKRFHKNIVKIYIKSRDLIF